MVRMGDVNHATVLHNLRMRFAEDLIYTNIGSILVSINPFANIPGLYAKEVMLEHLNLPPGEISQPHVFQVMGGGEAARLALDRWTGWGDTKYHPPPLPPFARLPPPRTTACAATA